MPRRIVSIALISLVLLGLLVPISVSFVQAKNEKNEKLIHVIIDTVGPPKNEHADAVKELGGKVKYKYKLIEALAVSIPESVIDKLLDKLLDKPWVKRISLDKEVHALLDVSVPTIKAPSVWNEGNKGSGIKIAICDTGIDKNHPDLKGKVVAENMFLSSIWGLFEGPEDNNGHGTHVAGIAAGTGAVYRGVAPGASLINAKCLDMFGSGYLSDVIAAIEWSIGQGADVISLSIGAPGPCDGTCDLCMAVDNAVDRGVVVVVAAGNSGPDPGTITCPGNAEKAITVGAADDHGTTSTDDDTITDWSSRGPTADRRKKPDVVAPGVNIMSCNYNTNGYIAMSGTSMATPHVSGAAALLLAARPDLTPAEVKAALKNSAINLGDRYDENTQGAGEINVYAAYQQVTGGLSVKVAAPTEVELGGTFKVTATITNNAAVDATGVEATITLPAGLSLSPGQGPNGIGNLQPGGSGDTWWQVKADSSGSYTITISASGSNGGLAGEGTTNVKVLSLPSIGITDLISPPVVYEGNTFTVKATIKNSGEAKATDVKATISFYPDTGLALANGENTVTVGDLAGGSSMTVTWNVKADSIGKYTLNVQATSSKGGDDIKSTSTEVQPKPVTPIAYVSIDMSVKSLWKLLWRVTATVTITSDSNINGATVVGHWSDAYQGTVSGTINNGKVSFRTPWIFTETQGSVSFTIDKVVKDGQGYTLTGDKTKSIVGP